jgi:hypothetical protein
MFPVMGRARLTSLRAIATALAALALVAAWTGCGRPGRTDPSVEIISWPRAAKYVGEYVAVEGRVVATHNSGKACFLNFHPDWRRSFSVVIFASRFDAFPPRPEDFYRGRRVRVTGVIREHEGRPEIILDSPAQIEVLR